MKFIFKYSKYSYEAKIIFGYGVYKRDIYRILESKDIVSIEDCNWIEDYEELYNLYNTIGSDEDVNIYYVEGLEWMREEVMKERI